MKFPRHYFDTWLLKYISNADCTLDSFDIEISKSVQGSFLIEPVGLTIFCENAQMTANAALIEIIHRRLIIKISVILFDIAEYICIVC